MCVNCYHLVVITESKFANDAALYALSRDGLEAVASFPLYVWQEDGV